MINTDYLYNPQTAENLYEKILPEKNSGVKILKRATILPFQKNIDGYPQCWGYGGVLDGNGRFIDNSVLFTGLDCYPYSPPPTRFIQVPKPSFISACFILFGGTP